MIKTYQSKVVKIRAVIWNGENIKEVTDFCCDAIIFNGSLIIKTLEGDMLANINDAIIEGTSGEFYPCKPKIFEYKYEEVKND